MQNKNSKNPSERFYLLQTVAETDQELSAWAQRLSNNRYLELGSDPALVKEIEQDLEELFERLSLLDPQFDIAKVPVRQANSYFAAASQLENAVSLVRDIRQKAYGSPQNTRRCLEQLELCRKSISEMGRMIAPGFSTLTH